MCMCIQDGKFNQFCQLGQILIEDERPFFVLAHHKWATLTWPLEACGEDTSLVQFASGPDSKCQWKFLFQPQLWESWSHSPEWSAEHGLVLSLKVREPFVKNCLRFSSKFGFDALANLAEFLDLERARRLSRQELLTALASLLSRGDEEFIQLVLASDSKISKHSQEPHQLSWCLLENFDDDEKADFKHVKDNLEKLQKSSLAGRWKELLAARTEEKRANKRGRGRGRGKGRGKGTSAPTAKAKAEGKGRGKEKTRKRKLSEVQPDNHLDNEPADLQPTTMDSDNNEMNDGQEPDSEVSQPPEGEADVDYDEPQPIVDAAEVLPLPNDEQLEPKCEMMPEVQLLQQQDPELQQQDPEEPPCQPSASSAGGPVAESAEVEAVESIPQEEPIVPEQLQVPVAAPAAKAAPIARDVGPRVHSTPEILKQLEPHPLLKLRLNMNDHRFICETMTREVHADWIGIYAQRTFSRGFQVSRDWKGALKTVHDFIWTKFNRMPDNLRRLRPGVATQEPGQVPEEIVRQLERVIAAMPAAKKYDKR